MLQERDLPEHYRVWRREDGRRDLTPGPLYKATDLRANRIVVLRFFEGQGKEALVRRTSLLLQAVSPGVAALRDVFTKDQTLVTVTDFVVGESLAERVARRGPLAPELVWEVAVQGVEALAALHERGVRHGQIGPSTILFPDDTRQGGIIRLVDCGLPQPGKVEEEEPGVPDDFRRLGISLWFALTGSFPFGGNPAAFAEGAPLTEPLLAVFAALLCGEPDRQPHAARSLLDALQAPRSAAQAHEVEVARVVPPVALPGGGPGASPMLLREPAAKAEESAGRKGAAALAIPLPKSPPAKSVEPGGVAGPAAIPLAIPPPATVPPKVKDGEALGTGRISSPGKPSDAARVGSSVVPAQKVSARETGTTDGAEAHKGRGKGWLLVVLFTLLAGAGVFLGYSKLGIPRRAEQRSAGPTASASPAPTAERIPPQPPRPAPLQARVDRIRELQPSLLGVLQFAPQMRRVETVTLPANSGVPDDAVIAQLKESFEWTQPSSPNFHRTAMLVVMGYANDPAAGQAVAASRQCAEDWATAITHSGMTSPIYACGLGAPGGLPDIAAAAAKADRFVEVWVAFTLM